MSKEGWLHPASRGANRILRKDQGTSCWPVSTPSFSSLNFTTTLFDGWGHGGTQREGTWREPPRHWNQVSANTAGRAQTPTAQPPLGPHMPGTMGPGEKPPLAQTRAGGSVGPGGFPSTRSTQIISKFVEITLQTSPSPLQTTCC